MDIKKFKNGKIRFMLETSDLNNGEVDENVYHDDMFFKDLYINQINGYQYIVDFNTGRVYELGSYLLQNPLMFLLDEFKEAREARHYFYLYPLSKRESKSLLKDLENGY